MGRTKSRDPSEGFRYRCNIVASIGETGHATPVGICAVHRGLVPVFDHYLNAIVQLLGITGGHLLDVFRLHAIPAFTALAVLVHHVCSRREKIDVQLFRHVQARSEKTRAESCGTCDSWTTHWHSSNTRLTFSCYLKIMQK
jgi:hypothetical protein